MDVGHKAQWTIVEMKCFGTVPDIIITMHQTVIFNAKFTFFCFKEKSEFSLTSATVNIGT
jgi:hypothetical protein